VYAGTTWGTGGLGRTDQHSVMGTDPCAPRENPEVRRIDSLAEERPTWAQISQTLHAGPLVSNLSRCPHAYASGPDQRRHEVCPVGQCKCYLAQRCLPTGLF
jgi:hypothetical protein